LKLQIRAQGEDLSGAVELLNSLSSLSTQPTAWMTAFGFNRVMGEAAT
jgi:hypothetical protein